MDIVIHYGEIGTKGKNRIFFEKTLADNINRKLFLLKLKCKAAHRRGYLALEHADFSEKDLGIIRELLGKTFGVKHFSLCERVEPVKAEEDVAGIAEAVRSLLGKDKKKTFKIFCKRSFKKFPLSSPKICAAVGKQLEEEGYNVDFENPDRSIRLAVHKGFAYVYSDKIPGPGGLPVGVSGKAVCLLSGGIDSPVAAWLAMKRGCEVILLHYHNSPKPHGKMKEIYEVLKSFHPDIKFIAVPFMDVQNEVISVVPADMRMIIYRRFMLRIAERIAEKSDIRAKAIVTGDSLGQVASQTLENMGAITSAVGMLVLRPLVGLDKEDIIRLAERIGTYEISIKPAPDCCSYMIDKHPVTKSTLGQAEMCEASLDVEGIVKKKMEEIGI